MCIRVPRCRIKCKIVAAKPSTRKPSCVPNHLLSQITPFTVCSHSQTWCVLECHILVQLYTHYYIHTLLHVHMYMYVTCNIQGCICTTNSLNTGFVEALGNNLGQGGSLLHSESESGLISDCLLLHTMHVHV